MNDRKPGIVPPLSARDWTRAIPWLLFLELVFLIPAVFQPGGIAARYFWDELGVSHVFPVQFLARRQVLSGHFPLWNPLSGMGLPLLADTLNETLLPWSLLKYLFPFPFGLNLYIAFKLFIALTGAYALGRRLGGTRASSILAGGIYGFTGFLAININNVIGPAFTLPWCLFALHRLAVLPDRSSMLLTALAFGFSLLGGNPQIPLQAALMGYGLYLAVLLSRRAQRGWGRFALLPGACIAAGGMIALPQALPTLEYLSRIFSHHVPGYGLLHLDPRAVITVMNPLFAPVVFFMGVTEFGGGFEQFIAERFPPASWADATIPLFYEYIGAAAIFFTLIALLRLRRLSAEVSFFAGVVVFSLGVSFGIFPFSLIGRVPPFTQYSNWRFYTFTAGISASALAAVLGPRLWRPFFNRRLWPAFALLALLSGGSAALVAADAGLPLSSPMLVLPALALIAVLLALGLGLRSGRLWLLAAACLLELLLYDKALERPVFPHPHHALSRKDELLSCMPEDEDFRFTAFGEVLHPSLGILLNRLDFRSYEMMFPDELARFIEAMNRWTPLNTLQFYLKHYYLSPTPEALTSASVGKCSLKFVLTDHDFFTLPADQAFEKAEIVAAGPGYGQPAEAEVEGEVKRGWFQHAPSLLKARKLNAGSLRVLQGVVALSPSAWPRPGDGVIMQAAGKRAGRETLLYSRYLDPRVQKEERRWIPGPELQDPGSLEAISISVLPGPKDDPRSDYALWADFHDPEKRSRFLAEWEQSKKGRLKCFVNKKAAPRLRLASSVRTVPDFETCLSEISAGRDSLERELLVDPEGSSWPAGKGKILEKRYGSDRVEVLVEMEEPAALVLADNYYPGWRAEIDGRPARIYRAECIFRAVKVPEGRHRVVFKFVPFSFRLGLWAGLSSFLCLAWFGGIMGREKKRGKQEPI